MNIIPAVMRSFELSPYEEFRVRYYVSRIGFQELWGDRPRRTAAEVESFYKEHDKDIWRQAYLGKYWYPYKKKVLSLYNIVSHLVPKTGRILDYGCGAGVFANYLAQHGYDVDVADIPSQTVEFVRKHLSLSAVYIIGQDSIPAGEYDIITSTEVLEHTFDPLGIVKNLLLFLRPGGYLIISFPVETDFALTHVREAQDARSATLQYLSRTVEVIIPEMLYRKPLRP